LGGKLASAWALWQFTDACVVLIVLWLASISSLMYAGCLALLVLALA
jgi:hypothetical protein